ncbi:hypothetical protein BX666DRAFT_1959693 [Dichotomocladium elegans]|nr:hypothetical protein BX666DRAFT_1959693 [Dichotomocladium elegans]
MRFTAIFIAAAALRITVQAAPAPPPVQQSHTGGTEATFPPSGLPGSAGKIASAFPLSSNLGANGADLPVVGAILKSTPVPSKVTNKPPQPQQPPPQKRQLPAVSGASLTTVPIVGPMIAPAPPAAANAPHKKRQLPSINPAAPNAGLPDMSRLASTPNTLPTLPILSPPPKAGAAPNGATGAPQKRGTDAGNTKSSSKKHGTSSVKGAPGAPTTDAKEDSAADDTAAAAATAAAAGQEMGSLEKAEQAVNPGVKGTVKNADEIVSSSKAAAVKSTTGPDVTSIDRAAGKAADAAEKATSKVKGTVQEAEGATPGLPAAAAGLPGLEDDQKAATAADSTTTAEHGSPAQAGHKGLVGKVAGLLSKSGSGPQ